MSEAEATGKGVVKRIPRHLLINLHPDKNILHPCRHEIFTKIQPLLKTWQTTWDMMGDRPFPRVGESMTGAPRPCPVPGGIRMPSQPPPPSTPPPQCAARPPAPPASASSGPASGSHAEAIQYGWRILPKYKDLPNNHLHEIQRGKWEYRVTLSQIPLVPFRERVGPAFDMLSPGAAWATLMARSAYAFAWLTGSADFPALADGNRNVEDIAARYAAMLRASDVANSLTFPAEAFLSNCDPLRRDPLDLDPELRHGWVNNRLTPQELPDIRRVVCFDSGMLTYSQASSKPCTKGLQQLSA